MIVFIIVCFLFLFILGLIVIKVITSIFDTRSKKKAITIKFSSINLGLLALVICILLISMCCLITQPSIEEVISGFLVELLGVLFDILVIIILFGYLNDRREKKNRIERHLEEIDDFRYWSSEESKIRILGILKRLNKEGHFEVDLSSIDIGGKDRNNSTLLQRLILRQSRLSGTKMKYCRMNGGEISRSFLTGAKLNESSFTNCNFKGSSITYTDLSHVTFYNCDLSNCKFTEETLLRNAKFVKVNISSVIFDEYVILEWVEVDYSFLIQLRSLNEENLGALSNCLVVKHEKIEGRKTRECYYLHNSDEDYEAVRSSLNNSISVNLLYFIRNPQFEF